MRAYDNVRKYKLAGSNAKVCKNIKLILEKYTL